MAKKNPLRYLLFPISAIYGAAIFVRNSLYDIGVLKEISFQFPIINVGNLSMGGTGKTPHVEYLLHLLQPYLTLATLSRGYKRKTAGFLEVKRTHFAQDVGDEPLLFKLKFPSTKVFVGEDRALSIPRVLQENPEIQTIILDDAFQHRAVRAGLNLLLTPYEDLFTSDELLPMGRLREFRNGANRASAIIVTKCPSDLTEEDQNQIKSKLSSYDVPVFFSTIEYLPIYSPFLASNRAIDGNTDILLISGIASNKALKSYLEERFNHIRTMEFSDHYQFTKNDIAKLVDRYQKMDSDNKAIVTTEKDLMRLLDHRQYFTDEQVPLYVAPIRVKFLPSQGVVFDDFIKNFLLNFKA